VRTCQRCRQPTETDRATICHECQEALDQTPNPRADRHSYRRPPKPLEPPPPAQTPRKPVCRYASAYLRTHARKSPSDSNSHKSRACSVRHILRCCRSGKSGPGPGPATTTSTLSPTESRITTPGHPLPGSVTARPAPVKSNSRKLRSLYRLATVSLLVVGLRRRCSGDPDPSADHVTDHITRTFFASSPLRPGTVSNSTRWPSSSVR
jgi:hypothetical protein